MGCAQDARVSECVFVVATQELQALWGQPAVVHTVTRAVLQCGV